MHAYLRDRTLATASTEGYLRCLRGLANNHTNATGAAFGAVLVALAGAAVVSARGVPSDCPVANVGTSGDDVLCGTAGADSMDGGAGNDELYGRSGADTITGNAGSDFVDGGPDNDTLAGGDGDGDAVVGDRGNDVLDAGPGADDGVFGDEGNDELRVRDGELDDSGACGAGTDSYDMDLQDLPNHGSAFFAVAGGCEQITVGAVNEGPNVEISRRTPKLKRVGKVPVRLGCPDSLSAPCAGTLTLGRTEKSEGAPKAYSVDPGARRKVAARLSRGDKRKLSRRGELAVRATSVEQGDFGEKTTVRTLKLSARG